MKKKALKFLAVILAISAIVGIVIWLLIKDQRGLMLAAIYRDRDLIEYYIDEKGVDPNKNYYNINLISLSMRPDYVEGDLDYIQFLLDKGVDTKTHSDKWLSPLAETILYENNEVAELLVKNGADVNEKIYGEHKILGFAVQMSALKHDDGANLDEQVFLSRCKMVDMLIEHGANLDEDPDKDFWQEHLKNCYK